jgi:hypothetical protein
MKNLYLAFLIILLPIITVGQILDRTETDCNGISRSVYQVAEEGKPLIIASKGLDCSTCMGQAPALSTFAQDYAGQIEVWGAMNYLYTSADPTCVAIANWENTYGWTNIFTFRDIEDYWVGTGFPTYRVINQVTLEEVYFGPIWNSAKNAALGLLSLSVEDDSKNLENIRVVPNFNNIHVYLEGAAIGPLQFEVLNVVGQVIASTQLNVVDENQMLILPFQQQNGMYLYRIAQNGKVRSGKFVHYR